MGLFKSWGRSSVGLDLDDDGVRVVKLLSGGGSRRLVTRARAALPPGAVTQGVVTDPDAVAQTLRDLWRRERVGSRRVVLGMLNQGVLMRLVKLPPLSGRQLERAMRYQAEDLFPVPLEQLVLDYAPVQGITEKGEDGLQVLLVAVQREMLDPHLQAVAKARLQPVIVDFSLLALLRVLPQNHGPQNMALLYLSGDCGGLLVVTRGTPRLARLLVLSSSRGDDATGWVSDLADEVSSSLRYYLTQPGAEPVDLVYMGGPGAQTAGLADLLKTAWELPVLQIDLRELAGTLLPAADAGAQDDALFALSTGLALRGLEA